MQTDAGQITLSLTAETMRRLKAFTTARNGSIHNQADAALCAGLDALSRQAPHAFQVRYEKALEERAGRILTWRGDVLTEQTDPAKLLEVIAHLGDEADALRQRLAERLAR
jgi:hypothetical protein